MPRPHYHPSACKVCERTVDEVGSISQTGLCPEHSRERAADNLTQLRARSGPYFRHWRRQIAASVGGVLLDDVQDTG